MSSSADHNAGSGPRTSGVLDDHHENAKTGFAIRARMMLPILLTVVVSVAVISHLHSSAGARLDGTTFNPDIFMTGYAGGYGGPGAGRPAAHDRSLKFSEHSGMYGLDPTTKYVFFDECAYWAIDTNTTSVAKLNTCFFVSGTSSARWVDNGDKTYDYRLWSANTDCPSTVTPTTTTHTIGESVTVACGSQTGFVLQDVSTKRFWTQGEMDMWVVFQTTPSGGPTSDCSSNDWSLARGFMNGKFSPTRKAKYTFSTSSTVDATAYTTADGAAASTLAQGKYTGLSLNSCGAHFPVNSDTAFASYSTILKGAYDGTIVGYVISSLAAVGVGGSIAAAIVTPILTSALGSSSSGGGGGGGGSASPAGPIINLLWIFQFFSLLRAVPVQQPSIFSGFAKNIAWTSLMFDPPSSFTIHSSSTTQRRRLLSETQNSVLASGSSIEAQWVGNIFYFLVVMLALLCIHMATVGGCYMWGVQKKKNPNYILSGNYRLPKWELLLITVAYQGLCISSWSCLRAGNSLYSTLAAFFLVLLVVVPLIPLLVVVYGAKKHLTYTKDVNGYLINPLSWKSALSDGFSMKGKVLFPFLTSWRNKWRETATSVGHWDTGSAEAQTYLDMYDFVIADYTSTSRFWVAYSLFMKFARAMVVGMFLGFVSSGYIVLGFLYIASWGEIIWRCTAGVYNRILSNHVNLFSSCCSNIVLLSMFFLYTNESIGGIDGLNPDDIGIVMVTFAFVGVFAHILQVFIGVFYLVYMVVRFVVVLVKNKGNIGLVLDRATAAAEKNEAAADVLAIAVGATHADKAATQQMQSKLAGKAQDASAARRVSELAAQGSGADLVLGDSAILTKDTQDDVEMQERAVKHTASLFATMCGGAAAPDPQVMRLIGDPALALRRLADLEAQNAELVARVQATEAAAAAAAAAKGKKGKN